MAERKPSVGSTFAIVLVLGLASLASIPTISATSPHTIDLEDFRWKKFPLKVLVDMNQWSSYDYANAIREALDTWVISAWGYVDLSNDTTLKIVSFFSTQATSILQKTMTY